MCLKISVYESGISLYVSAYIFKGQVRGVSHQGQEKTLHLKAGYIDADFPSFEAFPLHSHGGPYIRQLRLEVADNPFIGDQPPLEFFPLNRVHRRHNEARGCQAGARHV